MTDVENDPQETSETQTLETIVKNESGRLRDPDSRSIQDIFRNAWDYYFSKETQPERVKHRKEVYKMLRSSKPRYHKLIAKNIARLATPANGPLSKKTGAIAFGLLIGRVFRKDVKTYCVVTGIEETYQDEIIYMTEHALNVISGLQGGLVVKLAGSLIELGTGTELPHGYGLISAAALFAFQEAYTIRDHFDYAINKNYKPAYAMAVNPGGALKLFASWSNSNPEKYEKIFGKVEPYFENTKHAYHHYKYLLKHEIAKAKVDMEKL